jgi:hypothetical protein
MADSAPNDNDQHTPAQVGTRNDSGASRNAVQLQYRFYR